MPKYLCLQRSLPGGEAQAEKPSPAQMQAMYTKFNEWRESFQQNLVDLGGRLGAGRLAAPEPAPDGQPNFALFSAPARIEQSNACSRGSRTHGLWRVGKSLGGSMPVDVITETIIDRPHAEVAAYAGNPDNAPEWYVNIESVEWKTPPPLRVGSRLAFVARFLGRRLAYTYEFVELVPGERVVMRTAEGPFPMETTYTWNALGERRTHMTLRNRGEPSGFGRLAAPLMGKAMQRANRKDLAQLKKIIEARPAAG
jgi:uncharacterized membrane protein